MTNVQRPKRRRRLSFPVVVALAANALIALSKLVGFVFTGSSSMLAETFHSTADTGNEALLLFGEARSRRHPDRRHPFGHSRERYFWSFVVATMLFTLGSLVSLIEGVTKILRPGELESTHWAYAILLVAAIAESASLVTVARRVRRVKGRRGWWRFIRTTKSPDLPVVLLEDSASLLGLASAFAGIALTSATGDPRFDAIWSLAIGVILGFVAVVLAIEMKSLLIGEGASRDDQAAIRQAINSVPSILKLDELRTEQLGPDALLVVGRVEVDGHVDAAQLERVLENAEKAIREAVPGARYLYLRPVLEA